MNPYPGNRWKHLYSLYILVVGKVHLEATEGFVSIFVILTEVLGNVSDFPHLHDEAMGFLQQKDFVCRNHTHQAVDFLIQSGVAVVVPPASQRRRGVELIQIKKQKTCLPFFLKFVSKYGLPLLQLSLWYIIQPKIVVEKGLSTHKCISWFTYKWFTNVNAVTFIYRLTECLYHFPFVPRWPNQLYAYVFYVVVVNKTAHWADITQCCHIQSHPWIYVHVIGWNCKRHLIGCRECPLKKCMCESSRVRKLSKPTNKCRDVHKWQVFCKYTFVSL